jgi:hypothetical protein
MSVKIILPDGGESFDFGGLGVRLSEGFSG